MLPAIAVARFAAVLLAVLATALGAQNTSTGQVVITVVDQSGAPIPGASIGIIQLPVANPQIPNNLDWVDYALHASEQQSTRANTSGEATFRLAKGRYAVSIVAAEGFARFFERVDIRDESNQSLRATLVLVNGGCGVCVKETVPISLEHPILHILIPLNPLQTITLNATRVRRW